MRQIQTRSMVLTCLLKYETPVSIACLQHFFQTSWNWYMLVGWCTTSKFSLIAFKIQCWSFRLACPSNINWICSSFPMYPCVCRRKFSMTIQITDFCFDPFGVPTVTPSEGKQLGSLNHSFVRSADVQAALSIEENNIFCSNLPSNTNYGGSFRPSAFTRTTAERCLPIPLPFFAGVVT